MQTGWKTEIVSSAMGLVLWGLLIILQVFTVVAAAIIAACILFLSTNADSRSKAQQIILQ